MPMQHGGGKLFKAINFIVYIFFITMIGCSTVYVMPDGLQQIELQQSDCKIKAVLGHRWCKDNGVKSKVVCGVITGDYDPQYHCWLEIYYVDGWKLVDLNEWTDDGWPVCQYSEYRPYIIFNDSISILDIVRRTNYNWKSKVELDDLFDDADFARKLTASERIIGR